MNVDATRSMHSPSGGRGGTIVELRIPEDSEATRPGKTK